MKTYSIADKRGPQGSPSPNRYATVKRNRVTQKSPVRSAEALPHPAKAFVERPLSIFIFR